VVERLYHNSYRGLRAHSRSAGFIFLMAPNSPGTRNRNRRRVAAVSVASFLALLGYEAARVHAGSDPALSHAKAKSSTRSTSGSKSSQQSTTTEEDSTATQQGGSGYSGGEDSSSGGYYTPPATSTPSTGSS
jgi:hypothetical protein